MLKYRQATKHQELENQNNNSFDGLKWQALRRGAVFWCLAAQNGSSLAVLTWATPANRPALPRSLQRAGACMPFVISLPLTCGSIFWIQSCTSCPYPGKNGIPHPTDRPTAARSVRVLRSGLKKGRSRSTQMHLPPLVPTLKAPPAVLTKVHRELVSDDSRLPRGATMQEGF